MVRVEVRPTGEYIEITRPTGTERYERRAMILLDDDRIIGAWRLVQMPIVRRR